MRKGWDWILIGSVASVMFFGAIIGFLVAGAGG